MELQADELDADEFAIRTLAENLLAGQPRPVILSMLGCSPHEETDDHLLTAMTLAAGTFFFHRLNEALDLSKLQAADHPPAPVRLHKTMTALYEWLLANRPQSADWVVGDEYQRIMQIGVSSINDDARGAEWDRQDSFLHSAVGQAYLDSMEKLRQQRWHQVNTQRWKRKVPEI